MKVKSLEFLGFSLRIPGIKDQKQFKKKVREILFAILQAEDTYVEAPTFLFKMAKYVN